jgi:daunorubicin resistance ABC transporter ATP-binding subunit
MRPATLAASPLATQASSAVAIELHGVTKQFGTFTAVDHLSLRVERGEIFGLLGPNGSGKTTTINMVSGLSPATSGSINVLGYDIASQSRDVRAVLGTVPQETALYEELTAQANMVFHAELYRVPRSERDARIDRLLDLVQLSDRRGSRVGTFSGGMKRRLALARALLHEPQLVYLDEPTLGVDIQSRRALWDYIQALKTQGKTVLITTNYLEEANALCDRLAILDHGKLMALDTPTNLPRACGDPVIDRAPSPAPGEALVAQRRALPGVRQVLWEDEALHITINGEAHSTGEIVTLVTSETTLRSIVQREPNLEEVFLSLTGSALRD